MLDIYIGNLPEKVNVAELRELYIDVVDQKPQGSFLDSVLDNFRNIARGDGSEFTLVNHAQGRHARYCRITGHSRVAAKFVIEQLSEAGLHGHDLEVRPFHPRVLANDQRRAGWHFRRWLGVERRAGDRRSRL